MTTFLLALLIVILLTVYLRRVIKRVIVKPINGDGRVGPELLAEKTRFDALKEWLRPAMWGVVIGGLLCPAVGYWVGGWWQ